jgi:glutamate synthase domain-containing protein 2
MVEVQKSVTEKEEKKMLNHGQPNASSATGTRNRVPDSAPSSGICSVCLDGCSGPCEVAKSSYRGREVLYPRPFGKVTAGATKSYPVDYSHLNIQGTCVGAIGIDPNPDKAVFPAVSTATKLGNSHKVKLNLPVFTGALGSTDIAKDNWEGLAVGAAISGIMVVVGENVVGMDPYAEIKKGRVVRSPELERRVKSFKEWQDKAGAIILQQNVEDTRLGSAEYAIEELGVQCIELKWGQGAKNIGGEVKLKSLDRALELKSKGYVVLPDPSDKVVKRAFEEEEFREFERHSRLGMVEHKAFIKSVEHYRGAGAKFISLKTGAYRISDLARAMRYASDAELDLLTIDGAGGGTGMSPWRMMNEWGIPTVYLEAMAHKFASQLKAKGRYVPDIAMAGGFSLEDHIFKAIALGAPYVKAVCMGRALMIPAFIGKNIQRWLQEEKLPTDIKKYGDVAERIFISYETLRSKYGKDFEQVPMGAVAMYTFCDRLKLGLQQLMAGARKFAVKHVDRNDLVSLTKDAAEVTGIPYVMESDAEEAERILLG